MRVALVNLSSNKVENICLWSENSVVPQGYEILPVEEVYADFGMLWDGESLTFPPEPE